MELYNDELAFNLKTYGTSDMVKATVQRIKEKNKPTFAEKNGLVFVEEKIIETYNPLFELYGEQIVYIYKDNSGNIFTRTERYHE